MKDKLLVGKKTIPTFSHFHSAFLMTSGTSKLNTIICFLTVERPRGGGGGINFSDIKIEALKQ